MSINIIVLFISHGKAPKDNSNLSVKSKNIELEHLIANFLCRDKDIVENQSETLARNGYK